MLASSLEAAATEILSLFRSSYTLEKQNSLTHVCMCVWLCTRDTALATLQDQGSDQELVFFTIYYSNIYGLHRFLSECRE